MKGSTLLRVQRQGVVNGLAVVLYIMLVRLQLLVMVEEEERVRGTLGDRVVVVDVEEAVEEEEEDGTRICQYLWFYSVTCLYIKCTGSVLVLSTVVSLGTRYMLTRCCPYYEEYLL